jgi:predicted nucleotidyltransferase
MNEAENIHTSLPAGCRVILRSCVGSTVHGTSVAEQDDRDEMQLAVEPPEFLVGLQQWETTVFRTQPEGVRSGPGDLDLVTHSLRKYARLAASGNPTILLLLFSPPIYRDAIGTALLEQRSMFLSRKAGAAFQGYMRQQRMRMNGESGGRHGAMRVELVEKYGFDTKYAGHIIRLGLQGIELMTTGSMTLPMSEEARNAVVSIRTGGFTLPEVLQYAQVLEEQLAFAIAKSPLPEEPDLIAINRFLKNAYLCAWEPL